MHAWEIIKWNVLWVYLDWELIFDSHVDEQCRNEVWKMSVLYHQVCQRHLQATCFFLYLHIYGVA